MVTVTQSIKAAASTAVEAMDATNIVKLILMFLMPFDLDPVQKGVQCKIDDIDLKPSPPSLPPPKQDNNIILYALTKEHKALFYNLLVIITSDHL